MATTDYVPPITTLVADNERLRQENYYLREQLRDQFAMAALQGLCANGMVVGFSSSCGWAPVNCTFADIVQQAFGVADLALKARASKEEA